MPVKLIEQDNIKKIKPMHTFLEIKNELNAIKSAFGLPEITGWESESKKIGKDIYTVVTFNTTKDKDQRLYIRVKDDL